MTLILRAMTALLLAGLLAQPVHAQARGSWVQIEAQSGLQEAREAAALYARRIEAVNGFRLGATDWYAIALGPFTESEAEQTRRRLRAARLIPGDAFVTDGELFRGRFWPMGRGSGSDPAAAAAATPERTQAAAPPPDETRAEALLSERTLSAQERRDLQVALRWAGFYDSGIDGAFGRGTRGAMADWQAARGFDTTGVLTTAQRAALIRDYETVLDGLEMRPVTDDEAGITVEMPTARVAFDRREPPFVHYEPREADDRARVLLISQRGNRATLHGLYDIMQTLELVPETGRREKRDSGFTLIGENSEIVSHTEAQLRDGHVKGFTLVWPAGDEPRRRRVLEEMMTSFEADPDAVMGDMAGDPSENQSIDLLAGLRIRRPEIVRSGFYVSRRGDVLTTADAALDCDRITLDDDVEATPIAVDDDLGLALLKPGQPLAPRSHAAFQQAVPRLKTRAVAAGFSFDGALGAPSMSYGELADMRGLNGEEEVKRFAMSVRPGDAGGPVLDPTGAVLGMLLPDLAPEGRSLPDGVTFAADVETVTEFLKAHEIEPQAAQPSEALPRGLLETRASDMTVLVGCWK